MWQLCPTGLKVKARGAKKLSGAKTKYTPSLDFWQDKNPGGLWRHRRDSHPGERFCRPLPNYSATMPQVGPFTPHLTTLEIFFQIRPLNFWQTFENLISMGLSLIASFHDKGIFAGRPFDTKVAERDSLCPKRKTAN